MSLKELAEKNTHVVGREYLKSGEIPSIVVYGKTLPEAWEQAVLATLTFGTTIPTEYDQSVDPESRDSTMMIVVSNPLQEPRIHKALPCGYDDLEIYRQEVVNGVHDSNVRGRGWSYSYHDRIFNWPGIGSWDKLEEVVEKEINFPMTDQINQIILNLSDTPHSRRSQAITWVPWIDMKHHEPPCLQRIWCRVVKSSSDYLLEMNTHWRSRDAYKACFMNMFALTDLQREIAERISMVSREYVLPGRYIDISDSFHIYGSYIRKGEMDLFVESVSNLPFDKRVVRSDKPSIIKEFERGRSKLENEKIINEKVVTQMVMEALINAK